jgi:hypothetical protein
MALALALTASTIANGALPRVFAVQQQDRAVRAYCAEWRETHGIRPLDANQLNRRVVTRLETQYPTVFPECRPSDRVPCPGWIKATIDGLRHYGERSVKSICSSFEGRGRSQPTADQLLLSPREKMSSPEIIIEAGAFPYSSGRI